MLGEGAQASHHLGRAGSMTIDSVGREQTSYLRAFARAIAGGRSPLRHHFSLISLVTGARQATLASMSPPSD